MTNHLKINNYVRKNPTSLKTTFKYQDVLSIAKTILTCTTAGKEFAALRFLQEYSTPVKKNSPVTSVFRTGDPRRFSKLNAVKTNWRFNLAKKETVAKSKAKVIKAKSPGLKAKAKSTALDEDYSDFVIFLTNKLSSHTEKLYEWKYSIKDRVDWLNDDLRKGKTLSQSHKVLSCAGAALKYAIDNNIDQLCYESVRLIMDWGGVYYPIGLRSGNQKKIEMLNKKNILLESIACDYQKYRSEKIENVELMNAGWTKVWAVLFPGKFIMFDSRVSFAFTKLFATYCENKAKRNGFYTTPSKLGYRQIKQGKRNVTGFNSVNRTRPSEWANSMLITSKILNSCIALAEIQQLDISRYEQSSLRSIEARLFMMGGS